MKHTPPLDTNRLQLSDVIETQVSQSHPQEATLVHLHRNEDVDSLLDNALTFPFTPFDITPRFLLIRPPFRLCAIWTTNTCYGLLLQISRPRLGGDDIRTRSWYHLLATHGLTARANATQDFIMTHCGVTGLLGLLSVMINVMLEE